jgi:hypothetical protein
VQPKAVAFPTDAKLMHRARERLVKVAHKTGVSLRQSYARVGKHALIAHQRYAHAKQFKRANRALKTIRTYLGRVIRDIVRKIKGEAELESAFAHPLMLARRVREQRQHQRGCTPRRSSALAKARRIALMSLASRSRSPPRSIAPGAASSSPTPRHCRATLMTGIRWPP